jgi:hypothetical protein
MCTDIARNGSFIQNNIMPILTVFYIKLVISALLTLLLVGAVWKRALFRQWQLRGQDTWVLTLAFVGLRLLPFIGVYVILGQDPRNDVPFFYYKAESAFRGLWVYRDFWSFHAPLFSYIISLPLYLWNNPRAIVLLMVLMESLTVTLTYKTYKKHTPDALLLACVYWMLPASFVFIVLNGQEDIWFWLVTLLIWRHVRANPDRYETGAGLLFAAGLLCIKVTYIFFLLPLLVFVRRPVRMLAAMAIPGAVALSILYPNVGDKFLMPIQHTQTLLTPNLFSVARPFLEAFIHIPESSYTLLNWIGLVLTVGSTLLVAWWYRTAPFQHIAPLLFLVSFVSMTIFQPSAPGGYATSYLLIMLFALIEPQNRKHLALVLAFSWLLVIQPFIYVYLGSPSYTSFKMLATPILALEYGLQALNVGCYFLIVFLTIRKFRRIAISSETRTHRE